jgi:hypothetical protein
MNSYDNYLNNLKVTGISAHIEGKRYIESHVFIVTANGNFYLQDGIRVPAKDFERANTIDLVPNKIDKGDLLDGRSKWINS